MPVGYKVIEESSTAPPPTVAKHCWSAGGKKPATFIFSPLQEIQAPPFDNVFS